MKRIADQALLHKILINVILLVCISIRPAAQTISNYGFTSVNGTFTALPAPNTTTWTGNTDDAVSALMPIGFDFWYMGTWYTQVSATTNGWLTLGGVPSNYEYSNNLGTGGSPRPVIAPLWDDLDVTAFSNVTYKTTGTTGSRVFTLQYLNVKWNYLSAGSVCSFQVKLYEGSGKIEFVYRSDAGAASSPSASIGITAKTTGAGNFLSVNNNGTGVSATTEASITSKRATGRTYAFTPPVPAAPASLGFTGVTNSAMTLNWTDQSTNETGFVIYRSTDGVNYEFVSQTAANITSSVQSGLSGNTTYYWKVYSLSEGALSTAAGGSQTTFCSTPPPVVTSPVSYCLNANAVPLTASGTNLLWGGIPVAGYAGGNSILTTTTWVDNQWPANNKKTLFTTSTADVTISTVDYYIPAWQSVSGLVLAIYNSTGGVVAVSTTNTTQSASVSPVTISNHFNYTITTPGSYSIGVYSGSGVIGCDNPSFPLTEPTGTINITGVSSEGARCFNNMQFNGSGASAVAPTPVTATTGSTSYQVTQTTGGCTSAPATIVVNVTELNISQLPAGSLIGSYKFSGNAGDATANNNGTLHNAPASTADRFGVAGRAYNFNGSSQYISTANAYANPGDFTISVWFKTASTTGGRLIGFGREQTGSSGQYDRHIYMNNAGQLYFGIYNGSVQTISTVSSYNDNNWHLATATLSASQGMVLYIDGVQAGANAATTAENYTGYWRIGYDNLSSWTSQPSGFYFNGALDDALIYHRALTAQEVAVLYNAPDGAGNNGPVCSGSPVSLSATTLTGASYSWTGPNGFTATQQNPVFTYTPANAGVYTLQVTTGGCTAIAYTRLATTAEAGQWTGNNSTAWEDGANWCNGTAPTAATHVVISSTAARMPHITGNAACNNLTIQAGATLTLAAGGTLNMAGTLTNNGTMTINGAINFNGTSGQQTFSGIAAFYDLTISNAAGVLLPAAITVNNDLTIAAGALNANNFNIAVKGNWINNASGAAFTGGTATVTFNGAAAQVIGGSYSTAFNNLVIANTTAAVTLQANAGIGGNLTVNAGIFDLAGFTANRTSAGGVLTVSNNATLRIGGANTFPANYTTNTLVVASNVEYAGASQTIANQLYGNLVLGSSGGAVIKSFPATPLTIAGNLISTAGAGTSVSFTATSNITVNGNVSIGPSTVFNGNSYVHTIGGNWENNGTFEGNSSTIVFAGAGATAGGSGLQHFNNLTVAASLVSFSNISITLSGSLATTGAGSFTQAAGGTLVMTGTAATINGSGISPHNLVVTGSVVTATSLNLTGNLTVSGSLSAGSGIITMSGNSKTITGTGSKQFSTLSVTGSVTTDAAFTISSGLSVNGSLLATAGTATFTGAATLSGNANLHNVTIDGTYLRLSGNAILGIAGELAINAGTLDVTTSVPNTVNFNGSGDQTINAIPYGYLLLSGGGVKTATGSITTHYDINIGSGTTFNPSSHTHVVYGSWINNGFFEAGASTIAFMGPATAYITGATTFNMLTSNTSSVTTVLILQSNVTAATVNMTRGIILTGADTLTITGTRTGNGRILGNIRRTHSFTTGTAYAFESPENTISFSSVSSVTSITVTVTEKHIGNFPFGGAINLEYKIAVPEGTYDATLRLHYEDNLLNGNDESTMKLWNHNGVAWSEAGKSGNSTTLNFVEKSGLTGITGRWTLSDEANHIRWNGSVSSDWHTAANWTAIGGSPSTPPAANDIVDLGTAPFTHQPVISNNAAAKNIHFGSVQAVTLTLAAGGALTTAGNIDGEWSANAIHTIHVNNQTLTVNGDLILSDDTDGHAIDLTIDSGIVTAQESFTQSGGANVTISGTGTLKIHDDYNYTSGSFNAGSGTVVYNGDDNQLVANVTYNHLTIDKTAGIATMDGTTNILGDLVLTAGRLDNLSDLHIAGNVQIDSGIVIYDEGMIHVGGNWVNHGDYIGTGAHVKFNGAGTQTISASSFFNLEVDKPAGSFVILDGNLSINGNINIASGTFNARTYTYARNVPGGTAILGDSATVILGGNNPPLNFSTYSIAASSTIIFDGVDEQLITAPDITLGNLVLKNTGLKRLGSPLKLNGNLTIDSGTVFVSDSSTITLKGSWFNKGLFTPSTGTVLFTGASKVISGNTVFNLATVTGSYTILHNVTFDSLLHITATGSLSGGSTIHTTMNGDLINSGVLYTLGTTTYSGNKVQNLRLINAVTTVAVTVNFNGTVPPVMSSTSAPQFGFLNINNTGGVDPSVDWTILYALTIGSGASFNGGSSTHTMLGAVTNNGSITSSGVLNFSPSSAATINLGNNFSSTGTVVFGGTGAISLAGTPDTLTHVTISNKNAAGVTPPSGWNMAGNVTVDSGSTFNAGSYTYTAGGNFRNHGAVSTGTSTFILNGAGDQEVYSLSAFNKLTIAKNTGSATLLSDVTVNSNLSFTAGIINTNLHVLTIAPSATVTGAARHTGWVNGKLKKNISASTPVSLFEIGDETGFTPVEATFTGITTAGNLTAHTTRYDHPQISSSTLDATKSVNRYWTLTGNGIAFASYSATFHFEESDVDPGASLNAAVAGRYSDGAWTYPAKGSVTATSVQVTGLTTFVDFQIAEMLIMVKTWDGGAGTRNWGDAANWNTDGVPTANDEVELTQADTIDVDVAATAKKLSLNHPGLVLTINQHRSLSVAGDLAIVSGTLNTAAAFPAISGAVNITGGTVGFTGSEAQTIPAYNYNNLVSRSTGSRTLAGSGIIGIAGLFSPGSNTYTVTGSTVAFNGGGNQTMAAFNYHDLILANAGVKIFGSDTTGIGGALTMEGNATANAAANASTISYNGTTDGQLVTPIPYHNLDAGNTAGVVTLTDVTVGNNLSVTAGTASIGNNATARTIAVNGNISIAAGATLNVAGSSPAVHLMTVGGSITNQGTLDLRPNDNSLCNAIFHKNGMQAISGTGPTTRFNNITVNQGVSNSSYLDVTATHFTAPEGFLTLTNGTFNLNSAGVTITPFTADIPAGSYLIPATAGLSVNAGAINSANMNWTVAGLVKVTGGTLNMGNTTDNAVIPHSPASFTLNGGALNLASRIGNPGANWTLLIKGGVMTINTKGSTAAGIAPFNMDEAGCTFDMTGGAIVIQQQGGSAGQQLGYHNMATGGPGFTGGVLQTGNAFTPAGQHMTIASAKPVHNLLVNSGNATTLLPAYGLTVSNDVTVAAGTLDIGSRTLQIGGHISNSGNFLAGNGAITMNGTAAQTIPATAFTGNQVRNLTISNTEGVALEGALDITGILLAADGELHTNGHLTLVSTATQTALIDGSGSGEVLGNVTMQRYIASGFGYKYFSSPFKAATVNEFADDLDLNAAFPVFYRYDENQLSAGWIKYTNPSGILNPGEGYAGNLGASSAPKTVDVTGVVNNNTVTCAVLYNHNNPYTQGFNLVGNPYPSPIDWDAAAGWNRTNIDNAVYYFNAGAANQYTGTYSSYINGVSSDGAANNIIPAMQGFFVHVSDGAFPVAATLSVNNNARINNLAPLFHRRSPLTLPLLRISAAFADEKAAADPVVVYFDDAAATKGFDQEMDALKIMNTDDQVPSLYVKAPDTARLSICAWPELKDSSDIIPLGLKTTRAGFITFNMLSMERMPLGRPVYLYDAKTGSSHDMQKNPKYRVYLGAGDHENRFSLVFKQTTTAPSEGNGMFNAFNAGGRLYAMVSGLLPEENCTIAVSNMLGQVLVRRRLNGNGSHALGTSPGRGVYIVSFYLNKQVLSKKIIIDQ